MKPSNTTTTNEAVENAMFFTQMSKIVLKLLDKNGNLSLEKYEIKNTKKKNTDKLRYSAWCYYHYVRQGAQFSYNGAVKASVELEGVKFIADASFLVDTLSVMTNSLHPDIFQ